VIELDWDHTGADITVSFITMYSILKWAEVLVANYRAVTPLANICNISNKNF
jgi:hypothetical protein